MHAVERAENDIDEGEFDNAVGEGGNPPARRSDKRNVKVKNDKKRVEIEKESREELVCGLSPEERCEPGVDHGETPADPVFAADEKPANREDPADKKCERTRGKSMRLRSPSKNDRSEMKRRVVKNRYPSPRADRTSSATVNFGVPLASSARAPASAAVASSVACASAVTSAR